MRSAYQKLVDQSVGGYVPTECDKENYKYLSKQNENLFTSKDYETCKDDIFRVIDALKAIEANRKAHQALVKNFGIIYLTSQLVPFFKGKRFTILQLKFVLLLQ